MSFVMTGLCNYYGCVCLEYIEGNTYLTLDDFDGSYGVPVSKEFADMFVKEFADLKEAVSIKNEDTASYNRVLG